MVGGPGWCTIGGPGWCMVVGPGWCMVEGPGWCMVGGPGWCMVGGPGWCMVGDSNTTHPHAPLHPHDAPLHPHASAPTPRTAFPKGLLFRGPRRFITHGRQLPARRGRRRGCGWLCISARAWWAAADGLTLVDMGAAAAAGAAAAGAAAGATAGTAIVEKAGLYFSVNNFRHW